MSLFVRNSRQEAGRWMREDKSVQANDFPYLRDVGSQTEDEESTEMSSRSTSFSSSPSCASSFTSVFESESESNKSEEEMKIVQVQFPVNFMKIQPVEPIVQGKRYRRPFCPFCYSNAETMEVAFSHFLKDGQRNIVCPILEKHVCPICKMTGPKAHTLKYCPFNMHKESDNLLKKGLNSIGKTRRY